MSASTREYVRKPAGLPTGGEFAEHAKAGSGLALVNYADELTDGDDPWLQAADEDEPQGEKDPVAELVQLSEEITLATQPTPSVVIRAGTSPQEREREREEAHARAEEINAARRRLEAEYGTVEQAVVHAGHRVAHRAEELAGITAEEVRASAQKRLEETESTYNELKEKHSALRAEAEEMYGAERDELTRQVRQLDYSDRAEVERLKNARFAVERKIADHSRPAFDALIEAQTRLGLLRNGQDDQVRADLRRLSDGYLAALGEVRELGGQMVWHEKSAKKAREAFDEATAIFPADWVAASNDRVGGNREARGLLGVRTVADQAPVAKMSSRRAHYVDGRTHKTKKRMPRETVTVGFGDEDMQAYGRSSSPYTEYRELTAEERERHQVFAGDRALMRTQYEVYRGPYSHKTNPDGTPAGRGWEEWTDPADPQRKVWRRMKHRMQEVSSEFAPEITTNRQVPLVEGRSDTFAVSAHELSHRFEYSVPGLTQLEAQFLRRRTTDPETGEPEPYRPLWPGSRERVQADNFITSYTGKTYDGEAYEVLSTGVDSLFGGRNGGMVGTAGEKADPDMRAFILGVMATAGRRPRS